MTQTQIASADVELAHAETLAVVQCVEWAGLDSRTSPDVRAALYALAAAQRHLEDVWLDMHVTQRSAD